MYALGVLDGLLADVVGRDLRAVAALGVGDLDVVAEDLVEADLEAGDPGPADLVGLVPGDPGLAAPGQVALLVEVGVVAVADQAAFLEGERRVVDEGRLDRGADLGAELDPGLQLGQLLRGPRGEPGLDLRAGARGSGPGRRGRGARPGRSRSGRPAAPGRWPRRATARRSARRPAVADQLGHGLVAVDDRRHDPFDTWPAFPSGSAGCLPQVQQWPGSMA